MELASKIHIKWLRDAHGACDRKQLGNSPRRQDVAILVSVPTFLFLLFHEFVRIRRSVPILIQLVFRNIPVDLVVRHILRIS